MLKLLIASSVLLLSVATAGAQCGPLGCNGTGSNPNSHYVPGYTRSDGTPVRPHYRTDSNSTQYDNYSTRGNYNPHTGRTGTRNPAY